MKLYELFIYPIFPDHVTVKVHDHLPIGLVSSCLADVRDRLDPYFDLDVDTLYYVAESQEIHVTLYD